MKMKERKYDFFKKENNIEKLGKCKTKAKTQIWEGLRKFETDKMNK